MPSNTFLHHAPPENSAYLAAARDVGYHSVALLTALVWNTLVTLDQDVEYIWPMHNKRPYKWVYFFLRYGVILVQIVHNILIAPLANGSNPPLFCDMWHVYVVAFVQIPQVLLELILACRIYALYNRSRRVALLLLILILTEIGAIVRMVWMLPLTEFYGTCLLVLAPKGVGGQSIALFIVHCAFISLTLVKYFTFRIGYGRSPLVSLVVRDSTTVYGATLFILVSIAIICGVEDERGVIIALWYMTLTSILGCRLILGMERFAKETSINSSQPIFSEINLIALDSLGCQNNSPQSPKGSLEYS